MPAEASAVSVAEFTSTREECGCTSAGQDTNTSSVTGRQIGLHASTLSAFTQTAMIWVIISPQFAQLSPFFSLTGFKEGAGGQLQERAEAEGDGPRENVWAVRGGREAHARAHRHQAA